MASIEVRPSEAAEPPAQPLLAGRYRLETVIGCGGMATVYRAADERLGRVVAVKLLAERYADEEKFVRRFLRTARNAGRVRHRNVATVLDAGVEDGRPYLVTEYVAGHTLESLLKEAAGKPIVLQLADLLLTQLAAALDAVHEQGIIHCDVKPQNALVDGEGRLKLIDFGVSRLAAHLAPDQSQSIAGTMGYVPPEVLEGALPDTKSDVYALGLIAYQMLTGRFPYDATHPIALASQALVQPPEPPSRFNAALAPGVDTAVLRALARDPAERYATAGAFVRDLSAALREPSSAPTEPSPVLPPRPQPSSPPTTAAANRAWAGPGVARWLSRWREWRDRARQRVGRADLVPARLAAWRPAAAATPISPQVVLAVSLAALALVLTALLLGGVAFSGPPTTVPDVRGLTLDQATAKAKAAGFRVSTAAEEASETQPKGMVLRQEPAPPAQADRGSSLRLVVSSGLPRLPAPDVGGMPLEAARREVERAGFAVGTVSERDATDRKQWNVVVAQQPQRGAAADKGSKIDLVVAIPPIAGVPSVVDRALGDAQAALEQAGFGLGQVTLQPVANVRAGTVVAQTPTAGARLREGARIDVTIAVPPTAPAGPAVDGRPVSPPSADGRPGSGTP